MVRDISQTQSPREYVKVPNVTGLYRHTRSGRYYGAKKLHGKRREVSLRTTDRQIAERRLRDWIGKLHRVDVEKERTTFRQLIATFIATTAGKSRSTQTTNACVVKRLKQNMAVRPRHRSARHQAVTARRVARAA